MKFRLVTLVLAIAAIGSADTLRLQDGRTVEGTYLGGDARRVRMAVGDKVETYEVGSIASIQFGSTVTGAPASSGGQAVAQTESPAPAQAPPASDSPILRPAERPAGQAPERTILREREQRVDSRAAATGNVIPAGQSVVVRLIDPVDSEVNHVGQTFRASVDEAVTVDGRIIIPRGADAVTKLVSAHESGQLTGKAELTMVLDSLIINGREVRLDTGGVSRESGSRTDRSAKVVGGLAAGGALLGAIAGGGRGAAIGAVSGAGAGTAIQVLTKGERVRIPSETRLNFVLQNSVEY